MRVLVVEDDPVLANAITTAMRRAGYASGSPAMACNCRSAAAFDAV